MAGLSPSALYQIFSTGQYSDFTVFCAESEFKVHQNIICPESHFFEVLVKGNFMERNSVDLKEEDPKVIASVLHFLYFGNYHAPNEECTLQGHSNSQDNVTTSPRAPDTNQRIDVWPDSSGIPCGTQVLTLDDFAHHAEIYQSADRYDIQRLKELAAKEFLGVMRKPMTVTMFWQGMLLAYNIRSSDQCVLSRAIANLCLFNHQQISQYPDLVAVVSNYETASWHIACQVGNGYVQSHERIMKALVADSAVHSAEHTRDFVEYLGGPRYDVRFTCSNCGETINWITDDE